MNIEATLYDASAHFVAGVVFSGLDYVSYMAKNRRSLRLVQKKESLESIERILNAIKIPEEKTLPSTIDNDSAGETAKKTVDQSPEARIPVRSQPQPVRIDHNVMAHDVAVVKEYLRRHGYVKYDVPLVLKVKDFFHSLMYDERLNTLSNRQKLLFAGGIEIIYDTGLGFSYYTNIVKESPVAAFARNLYQIPMFFSGLVVGSALRRPINWLLKSREETKLDKAIVKALYSTPIIEFTTQYEPPSDVQQQMESEGIGVYGTTLTSKGQGICESLQSFGRKLAERASGVAGSYTRYRQAKDVRDEQDRQRTRTRFDEITRGH